MGWWGIAKHPDVRAYIYITSGCTRIHLMSFHHIGHQYVRARIYNTSGCTCTHELPCFVANVRFMSKRMSSVHPTGCQIRATSSHQEERNDLNPASKTSESSKNESWFFVGENINNLFPRLSSRRWEYWIVDNISNRPCRQHTEHKSTYPFLLLRNRFEICFKIANVFPPHVIFLGRSHGRVQSLASNSACHV